MATAAGPRQIRFPGILVARVVSASSKPPEPKGRPRGDARLRRPGWAGELAPDELAFLEDRLQRDKRLALKWAFRPGVKRRPEGVIRRVAMHGDPDNRRLNLKLARQARAEMAQGSAMGRASKRRGKAARARRRPLEPSRQLVLL